MASKLWTLRIMADDEGRMNRSLAESGGGLLVISQFTLYGDAPRGAARPLSTRPRPRWRSLSCTRSSSISATSGPRVETGSFGAHMLVELANDGPVTSSSDTAPLSRAIWKARAHALCDPRGRSDRRGHGRAPFRERPRRRPRREGCPSGSDRRRAASSCATRTAAVTLRIRAVSSPAEVGFEEGDVAVLATKTQQSEALLAELAVLRPASHAGRLCAERGRERATRTAPVLERAGDAGVLLRHPSRARGGRDTLRPAHRAPRSRPLSQGRRRGERADRR